MVTLMPGFKNIDQVRPLFELGTNFELVSENM